jgi:hypothetical protein
VALVGLSLIGCASTPSNGALPVLEGTWVKEDGTTFTFTGKNYELVDLANGVAGYGTFKFEKGRIRFTNESILDLKGSTINDSSLAKLKDFLQEAFKTYHSAHPEQIAIRITELTAQDIDNPSNYTSGAHGGFPTDYVFNGNTLQLSEHLTPTGSTFYSKSYSGLFIKQ